MADYFVASGGSNTAPYDTWAKAATSLQTALTAATATGDRVIIQYNAVPSGDAELAADTTYTIAGNIQLISASNDGGSAFTATEMGTANWIGNSTTNRGITFTANRVWLCYGVTLRTSGSTTDHINIIDSSSNTDSTFENCYFWSGNSSTSSRIAFGHASSTGEARGHFKNCTFRFGSTSQGLLCGTGRWIFEGCTIPSSAGSAPSTLIRNEGGSEALATIDFCGSDLSQLTGTLVADIWSGYTTVYVRQCKLAGAVTIMASQTTNPHRGGADVWVMDSDSGDNHYQFQHHNAMGSLTIDTGVYVTADGAAYNAANARASWKIVTTANAKIYAPYISPWITVHHEGTAAITPYLEGVVTTTAPKDDEIWGEFMFKGTSGFTTGTINTSDRVALAGTPADQTTGTLGASDWTGEPASPQFFKLSPTSTITPAEIGDLTARICVGKASTTYYIDPNIRGTGYTPSLSRVTVNGFRQELQSGTATPDVFLGGSSL